MAPVVADVVIHGVPLWFSLGEVKGKLGRFFVAANGDAFTFDVDVVRVVGEEEQARWMAVMVGMDPRVEIAVLKVEGMDFPHFNLDEAASLEAGARVLAFNNLDDTQQEEVFRFIHTNEFLQKNPFLAQKIPYSLYVKIIEIFNKHDKKIEVIL